MKYNIKDTPIYTVDQFDYVIQHLINKTLTKGTDTIDRTRVGTKSIFSEKISVNVRDGIPITTLKKTPIKTTIMELAWFLVGSSNINELHSKARHWWTPWSKLDSSIGDMYGYMMTKYCIDRDYDYEEDSYRSVNTINQFTNLIDGLIHNPYSRRHVISLWNPDLENMALATCHGTHIQFNIEGNKLSMDTHQRSMDFMLGGFVNFTSYAVLLHIVAKLTGYEPHIMHYNIGNLHIYNSHLEAAKELLTREPINCNRRLIIDPELDFENLMYDTKLTGEALDKDIDRVVDMLTLLDYKYHPSIKLPIAV